jgi:hypothetical protein
LRGLAERLLFLWQRDYSLRREWRHLFPDYSQRRGDDGRVPGDRGLYPMNYDEFLRWLVIVLAVIGSVCWMIWAIRNKQLWGFSIAPLTYLAHVLVFTVNRLLNIIAIDPIGLNRWSTYIRAHSLIVIILAAIVMLLYPDRKKMLEQEIRNKLNGG